MCYLGMDHDEHPGYIFIGENSRHEQFVSQLDKGHKEVLVGAANRVSV